MLRDPVDRTVSYLKHCKRWHAQHQDLSLDEIYDDYFHFKCFIENHQTKIFSMTTDDKLESFIARMYDQTRSFVAAHPYGEGEPEPE